MAVLLSTQNVRATWPNAAAADRPKRRRKLAPRQAAAAAAARKCEQHTKPSDYS